jgi:anti-sigma factor RsiW
MSSLTCKDFLRELNAYLDETIDPQERQEIEKHLSECPNCWVVTDTTKRTIHVYKGMAQQEIPADVHQRLMRAIEKRCASRGQAGGGTFPKS